MTFTLALASFTILTLILLSNQILYTYATQGFSYGFSSNRDPNVSYSPLALRIANTFRNQVEAAAYVVPVLGLAAIVGLQDPNAQIAALLVVLGRVLFSILYYLGLPFVRVLGFLVTNLSVLYILFALFSSGLI